MDVLHLVLLIATGVLSFLAGVHTGCNRVCRVMMPAYRHLFRFAVIQSHVLERHGVSPEEFGREADELVKGGVV